MASESTAPPAFAVFATLLDRWETPDLQQAAKDIEDLTRHPGYRVLHRVIQEKREQEMLRLIHGKVLEQANYAAITSTISGLDSAIRVAEAVQFAAEVRDEREQQAAADRLRQEAS